MLAFVTLIFLLVVLIFALVVVVITGLSVSFELVPIVIVHITFVIFAAILVLLSTEDVLVEV